LQHGLQHSQIDPGSFNAEPPLQFQRSPQGAEL
jgi:hypothetical protein